MILPQQPAPLVSVCIPTYNYGRFVADAIESVLAQTFTDFELIIVDNCSTDNTQEIVEQISQRDVRLSYHRNETNLGMVPNWNKCLAYARGKYVKILCADDLLLPDSLGRAVKLMESDASLAMVSCARNLLLENLSAIGCRMFALHDVIIGGHAVINQCLMHLNLIGEPTAVLFRKHLATRGFNEQYRHLADLEMWFHLLEQGGFAYTAEPLCNIRLHGAQETELNVRTLSAIQDEISLFAEYFPKEYVTLSYYKRLDRKLNAAFALWEQSVGRDDRAKMKEVILQQCNWLLFCLFCGQKRVRRFFKARCADPSKQVNADG